MSASWGLPGAMLLRRSLSRHFRPAATRQHTFGADDRIARLFSDRIARRRHHIYLRCYVVIELKVKPFDPEYAGKLNFYVNAVNEFIRRESDNPTIGLLICKDMDHTEVQLAFLGITTPMGVATYDNVRIKEIQEQLPTPEQIKEIVDQAEHDYLQGKQKKN